MYPEIFLHTCHIVQEPATSLISISAIYYKILSCGIKLCMYLRFRDYLQRFGKIIIPKPNARRVFYEKDFRTKENEGI
jgi:hypothetical protein